MAPQLKLALPEDPVRDVHGSRDGPVIRIVPFGSLDHAPPALRSIMSDAPWCEVVSINTARLDRALCLRHVDAAVVVDTDPVDPAGGDEKPYEDLIGVLRRHRLGIVVMTTRPWLYAGHAMGLVCISPEASVEMLRGALVAMSHLRPVMRQIDLELTSMQHLGDRLARHFEELDHELRLAARLQQDFLPRELPRLDALKFATIYRPCSWVSGDIFDVFVLDEHRVGFYLADAVGHGVAAGLLTMFIREAIRTRRLESHAAPFVLPSVILNHLNDALAAQALPDSQFVTAWYGVVDTRTLELTYATGGHPPPVLVHADGRVSGLEGDGCLLGVFGRQIFEDRTVTLRPGERLLVYSDGFESALLEPRTPRAPIALASDVAAVAHRPAPEFIDALIEQLDAQPGSLSAADDTTLVLVDVVGR